MGDNPTLTRQASMSSIQSGNALTGFLIRLTAKNFPELLRVQDLGLHLVTSLASTNYPVDSGSHMTSG